jgi:hypothetical protein
LTHQITFSGAYVIIVSLNAISLTGFIPNISPHLPLPNANHISNPAVKPRPSLPGKINPTGKTT